MTEQRASLKIGGRELLAMLIGIVLYGGISWLTSISALGGAIGGEIRPGIAIPIVLGFVYGPIVGFVVGAGGNFMFDLIAGNLMGYPLPPESAEFIECCEFMAGYLVNYQIGNGLIGFIPGLYALFHKRYRTITDQLIALVVTAVAIIAGVGFAAGFDVLIYGADSRDVIWEFIFVPIVRVNLLNAIILVPILLFNYERLDLSSMDWLSSGLVRRLVLAIVISAALPVGLLGMFLVQSMEEAAQLETDAAIVEEVTTEDEIALDEESIESDAAFEEEAPAITTHQEVSIKLGFTILITLLFAVTNAALVAQTISRPLIQLTSAARQMETGDLTQEEAAQLKETEGQDEVSRLSQIFGGMAQEVIQREERLKRQVEELKIEIDLAKQEQQVSEITDNEYFRELQEKVSDMRRQSKEGRKSETPASSTSESSD